jgi:hypothetical protein
MNQIEINASDASAVRRNCQLICGARKAARHRPIIITTISIHPSAIARLSLGVKFRFLPPLGACYLYMVVLLCCWQFHFPRHQSQIKLQKQNAQTTKVAHVKLADNALDERKSCQRSAA